MTYCKRQLRMAEPLLKVGRQPVLQQNILQNRLANVTAHCLALSDTNGTDTIYMVKSGNVGASSFDLRAGGGEPLEVSKRQGDEFLKEQTERYDWLPAPIVRRYARAYGTRMDRLLEGAVNMNSLGRHFGDDLYQAEIDYLIKAEWAKTADDILWRRSKLGLHLEKKSMLALESAMPDYLKASGV